MKYLSIILLLGLLLLGASCSQQKESLSSDDALTGDWKRVHPVSKKKQFISFEKDGFTSNLLPGYDDTITGKWSYVDSTKQFDLVVYSDGYEAIIDSSKVRIQNDNVDFVHYSDGEELVVENKDNVTPVESKSFKLKIKGDRIQLSHKGKKIDLHRPVIQAKDTSMTFSLSSILRGLLGMAFLIGLAWLFSANRKGINWNLIAKGVVLQFLIAFLVLKVPFVEDLFNAISWVFVEVIQKTDAGVSFLFAQMGTGEVQPPLITFAVKVLPTIIFFSALVSLFYYWGILQKIVYIFAWIMKRFMKLSGAESLAAAGNVFLGQTEAPLLVKPYLLGMTKSEIMCLMTGGMATIAGGVLAAYVSFLGGDDPAQQAFFAKHLLTASIISAPAAIVAAKILIPETETINENLKISKEKIGANSLEAIANGTTDGLKLAVNVGAMLLVFTALMALGNWILDGIGSATGANEAIAAGEVYNGLSFEFLLGYAGRPIVWMMGVDWVDSIYVGELLGTKTILNEFVAYPRLGEMKDGGMLSEKSVIMSTYMLCGFANFASIGIQIGGIGSLVPTRKGLLSKLGVRALIGGTIACLMTAVIVGMTL